MRLLFYLSLFFLPTYSKSPETCCVENGVSSACARSLCRPLRPPGDMERYTIFDYSRDCQRFLPAIARCLSNGRDSTSCCNTEVKRTDIGSCLGICGGSVSTAVEAWAPFKSCFILNVDPIYRCFEKSYVSHPTPPVDLRILSNEINSVNLQWDVPQQNSHKVHIYKVHVIETSGFRHEQVLHDTKETEITIDNLSPDKKYSVFVVAHGKDNGKMSLPSKLVHFFTSNESKIGAVYEDDVAVPRETKNVTLACHLRQGVVKKKFLIWEKKDKGVFKPLSGMRYKVTTYSSEVGGLLYFVSALEINPLQSSDFGTYKCHLEGETNDHGEVRLREHSWSKSPPPSSPPETPLQCCSKSLTGSNCQSICSSAAQNDRKKDVKPAAFLPHFHCLNEFQNLLQCTLKDMNNVGCCIRKKVPYHCLGMCDSRFMMKNLIFSDCMNYVNKVNFCQAERMDNVPDVVSAVRAETEHSTTLLSWEPSDGAEIYHVYHRKNRGTWTVDAVQRTTTTLRNVDEVALMAVNKFGQSGAYRIASDLGVWSDNYL